MKKMKVAVLVSGGVDSSVALQLLKNQGHEVTAFYLKIWLEDELSYLGSCPWETDLMFVKQVCEQLEVPLEVISLQKEYKDEVVSYTIAQVKAGRTPNPDILCNQRIKFGLFLDKIDGQFEKVASGHYAQVREKDGLIELFQSPDLIKDQTYFLSHLNQQQLKRVMFPIGHLQKSELRMLAHEFNLPNKDRKDSQGICFLGKFKFADFVKHHLGTQVGQMIEVETGSVMGSHDGFWFYTIGQRQGLGLGGGPWYVVAKDIEKNIIFISRNYYDDEKQRNLFIVEKFHWLSNVQPDKKSFAVKLRHGAQRYECSIEYEAHDKAVVTLSGRDQGIAPGQYAVFYDGDVCVGSGVISYEKN
ncbi:MAG TPA: tRNA 2-thiouridine(34) synthase MnmA [Candidatus Babeliales bacterium]|jgi:tRNA (5-methylaminomethyl-2-thiouridylate)-methyltransferase|nr:tRNA 2-thiouridine(34) synthase MnmA [Candidatus Babeliales bacterium]